MWPGGPLCCCPMAASSGFYMILSFSWPRPASIHVTAEFSRQRGAPSPPSPHSARKKKKKIHPAWPGWPPTPPSPTRTQTPLPLHLAPSPPSPVASIFGAEDQERTTFTSKCAGAKRRAIFFSRTFHAQSFPVATFPCRAFFFSIFSFHSFCSLNFRILRPQFAFITLCSHVLPTLLVSRTAVNAAFISRKCVNGVVSGHRLRSRWSLGDCCHLPSLHAPL